MNSHSTMNQGSKEYKDESYIDIGLFFSVLKKRLVWILAIAILFAVIAGVYTSFFVTPMYRTMVKFDIITENYSSNAGSNFSINLATYLNDSEEMAKYVIEALFLKTPVKKQCEIAKELGVSQQAISKIVCSAKKKLKKFLEKWL